MKKITYASLLFFCITTLAFGQGLPIAVPEEVGVSTERLQRIQPAMQEYVDEGHVSGFLTAIARRGKVVHFETVGMRDVENNKPVEADTLFRIYSMSKPITSVAVMMLYEEGHFQLDTPVAEFIPEFKNMKFYNEDQTETRDAQKPITVKHLLMHTAGFTYGWGNKPVDKLYGKASLLKSSKTLDEMVQNLAKIPLVHEPGEEWTYGVSTDVLGYLVEVVAEMPFEEFLQTRIFQPLGMVDTGFSVPMEKAHRFAALYRQSKEEGMKLEKGAPFTKEELIFFPAGGSGLVSTAADYLRFSQMLLNGGELDGVRILGKETVELMRQPHHRWGKSGGFGLGFAVVTEVNTEKTSESVGSFSWGGAAATTFWIDPEKELIGVLMTQLMNNPHPFQQEFKKLTYEALIDE
ncbi:serine hydrolase [Candidatus Poribacteria bacterium]|nr:MAG: serine hydrolase [Candidatus Poribacteria bacterium]